MLAIGALLQPLPERLDLGPPSALMVRGEAHMHVVERTGRKLGSSAGERLIATPIETLRRSVGRSARKVRRQLRSEEFANSDDSPRPGAINSGVAASDGQMR